MSDAKFCFVYLYKNGSGISNGIAALNTSLANNHTFQHFFIDTANTTDYYEVYLYHNDSGARTTQESTYFGAFKIIT